MKPLWRAIAVAQALLIQPLLFGQMLDAADTDQLQREFSEIVQPVLSNYCFDCHADGAEEGGLTFDSRPDGDALLGDRELWLAVLNNLRAGIMPPADAEQPSEEERQRVTSWIKTRAFGVDPENLDPGQVTVRRLNRTEYRNTIRDLMGIDFNAEIIFPPDDTGFGFDNVGDALSLSPLLLEKYLQAAETIIGQTVPTQCIVIPRAAYPGEEFRSQDGEVVGEEMLGSKPSTVSKSIQIDISGRYRILVEVQLDGSFNFDPTRYRVEFFAGDDRLLDQEYGWDENKSMTYEFDLDLKVGEHDLTFHLKPIPLVDTSDIEDSDGRVQFRIQQVSVLGPQDQQHWSHPPNYERYFSREEPPSSLADRRQYAREVITAFAKRAYRRPPDASALDRLVALAEFTYTQPNKTFEAGVAQAMAAVLASPRFLFRLEAPEPADLETANAEMLFPRIDEYSLASRLSYFLWSSMPDEELFDLADRGLLRERLQSQIDRMLADPRSDELVQNFVGQWLRSRDAEHVSINALAVYGVEEEYENLRVISRRRYLPEDDENHLSDEQWDVHRARYDELRTIRDRLRPETRVAMQRETEMMFEHIVREDRSLLELIDSDYTFLNESLAELYEISGIEGDQMRRVTLPPDSPRGGVLTQGTMLTVTSNPTRTSPVKRGLFILENILGTPSPPAPAGVPELEEASKRFGDREPTLREVLAAHREAALCSSCHSRMDPLGIALENFNALGIWRDQENEQPVDAAGQLITGESFQDIRELKKILASSRRMDFYRCVTQKMMTYALGRGLEYYDQYTVDQIAKSLDQHQGRFSVLLKEVVQSAPFQRQRGSAVDPDATPSAEPVKVDLK